MEPRKKKHIIIKINKPKNYQYIYQTIINYQYIYQTIIHGLRQSIQTQQY